MATAAIIIDTRPESCLLEVTRGTSQSYTITFDTDVAGQTLLFLVKASTTMLSGGYRVPVPDSDAILSHDNGLIGGITLDGTGMIATLTLAADDVLDPAIFPEGRILVWSLRLVELNQDVLAGQLVVSTEA